MASVTVDTVLTPELSLEVQLLTLLPRIASIEQELRETKMKCLSLENKQKTLSTLLEQRLFQSSRCDDCGNSRRDSSRTIPIHISSILNGDDNEILSNNKGLLLPSSNCYYRSNNYRTMDEERNPRMCKENTDSTLQTFTGHVVGNSDENTTVLLPQDRNQEECRISTIENSIITLCKQLDNMKKEWDVDREALDHNKSDISYIKENYVQFDFMKEVMSAVEGKLTAVMSSAAQCINTHDDASLQTQVYNLLIQAVAHITQKANKSDIYDIYSPHSNSSIGMTPDDNEKSKKYQEQSNALWDCCKSFVGELVRNELEASLKSNITITEIIHDIASKVACETTEGLISLSQKVDNVSNKLGCSTVQSKDLEGEVRKVGDGMRLSHSPSDSSSATESNPHRHFKYHTISPRMPVTKLHWNIGQRLYKNLENVGNGNTPNDTPYLPLCTPPTTPYANSSGPIRTSMGKTSLVNVNINVVASPVPNHHKHTVGNVTHANTSWR